MVEIILRAHCHRCLYLKFSHLVYLQGLPDYAPGIVFVIYLLKRDDQKVKIRRVPPLLP